MDITVTDGAVGFLNDLLSKSEDHKDIKLFVENGGTPLAETMLTYCNAKDEKDSTIVEYDGFNMAVDNSSIKFLEECIINYDTEQFGGQLTIKAPNSKINKLDENSTLEEKVNYYLYNDVAPMLAQHGGNVRLHKITEDNMAVLEFGGGCQGCSAVDMTLTHGIEQIILQNVPEIKGIMDMTDHSLAQNAYYKDESEINAYGGF